MSASLRIESLATRAEVLPVVAAAAGTDTLYLLTTEREEFYAQLGWGVFDRAGEEIVMSRRVAEPGR
jgi:N-acetylglutamate synthase-like GNAT family acetyltransferase